ncbi:MAG: RidA family protein [Bacillota bacterium]
MKQEILTKKAPAPIGPYSQAVKAGGFLFLSGQIALDPVTGVIVSDNVQVQIRQVMENIKAVLEQAGLGFDSVVKTTIFLADMNDFTVVNQVYGEYFSSLPPARSTVQVAKLPKGARVEVEMVAVCD